ncbi:hypothetical protein [Palleronia sp.]|uniref:hypothetical protein n=1 Tax=Palleronia sp. TaxID=1940284 RepID=UPI0035C7F5F6
MNIQTPRPHTTSLARRFEIELSKCTALRTRYETGSEGDRAGNARMLACATFWAFVALEELVVIGPAPVGAPEPREIVSLRDALGHPLTDPDLALRAHDRLQAFATAA